MNTILYASLLLAGEDVVVYGATPAGIAAALQVKRMGHSVLLLEPTAHVGGLTASGLGTSLSAIPRG